MLCSSVDELRLYILLFYIHYYKIVSCRMSKCNDLNVVFRSL